MSALAEFLASHHYTLTLTEDSLTGSGVDFLQKEAQASRYFLIGEDHGVGSNLKFSAALFKAIQAFGYNTYITEIGPISTEHIYNLLNQPDSRNAFKDFFTTYPFSVPFAWLKEEVHLLQAGQATMNFELIGIDQEFILSPQLHFETLLGFCHDHELKDKISDWLKIERAAMQEMYAGKPPDQLNLFMNLPLPAEWLIVWQYFETTQASQALAIMEALTISHEIYMHYKNEAYHLNNFVRAGLMKRYFLKAHRNHPKQTKYLIKLGANHIERGYSAMGVQDIGNLISELAVIEDTQSFHLYVLPVSGRKNMWLPFLPEELKATLIDENTQLQFTPLLEIVPEKTGWHLFDLRPLRLRQNYWGKDKPELKKLIQGYDAILLMYNVEPATLIVE